MGDVPVSVKLEPPDEGTVSFARCKLFYRPAKLGDLYTYSREWMNATMTDDDKVMKTSLQSEPFSLPAGTASVKEEPLTSDEIFNLPDGFMSVKEGLGVWGDMSNYSLGLMDAKMINDSARCTEHQPIQYETFKQECCLQAETTGIHDSNTMFEKPIPVALYQVDQARIGNCGPAYGCFIFETPASLDPSSAELFPEINIYKDSQCLTSAIFNRVPAMVHSQYTNYCTKAGLDSESLRRGINTVNREIPSDYLVNGCIFEIYLRSRPTWVNLTAWLNIWMGDRFPRKSQFLQRANSLVRSSVKKLLDKRKRLMRRKDAIGRKELKDLELQPFCMYYATTTSRRGRITAQSSIPVKPSIDTSATSETVVKPNTAQLIPSSAETNYDMFNVLPPTKETKAHENSTYSSNAGLEVECLKRGINTVTWEIPPRSLVNGCILEVIHRARPSWDTLTSWLSVWMGKRFPSKYTPSELESHVRQLLHRGRHLLKTGASVNEAEVKRLEIQPFTLVRRRPGKLPVVVQIDSSTRSSNVLGSTAKSAEELEIKSADELETIRDYSTTSMILDAQSSKVDTAQSPHSQTTPTNTPATHMPPIPKTTREQAAATDFLLPILKALSN